MPWGVAAAVAGSVVSSALAPGMPSGQGGVFGPGVYGYQTFTPGFDLQTGLGGNGDIQTTLKQTGSMSQLELARRFPGFLSTLDTLGAQAAPNASLFRTAAMGQLNAGESSAVGNLKQQLAQRGLSGASFSNDVIGNVQAEFSKQRAGVELQAAQQEFSTTFQVVQAQNELINQQLNQELAQLGIASGIQVNLNNTTTQSAIANAQIAAAQSIASSQSQGALLGTLAGATLLRNTNSGGGSASPTFGASGFFGSGGLNLIGSNGLFSNWGSPSASGAAVFP